VLSGLITISRSKNGASRQVPMNAVVRSMLFDLSAQRRRPNDPDELIFDGAYRTVARLFSHAVRQAQTGLRGEGKDANRLEGNTWHSNRHSFASRLVMAGVDLRTVPELGGWKTLSMGLRYSHLAPSHLQAAVERLVPSNAAELARN
jgi:site-specific recombinase XerD